MRFEVREQEGRAYLSESTVIRLEASKNRGNPIGSFHILLNESLLIVVEVAKRSDSQCEFLTSLN